jgi:uncharacterized damage-inducible protein DinB
MSETPSDGIREALLQEFDIAKQQLLGLATAMPAEKFGWRPDATARCVSEVFVHIAAGNFFLLDWSGRLLPEDIYGRIAVQGEHRWMAIAECNDELEKTMTSKDAVLEFLTRSLLAAREDIAGTSETALHEPPKRQAYFRMIAHLHEHMGQMIAYTRTIGLPVPWPDWRPDRRP